MDVPPEVGKTAILLFSRNVGFGDVLAKASEAVPKHPCYKRDLGKTDETSFRYIFHQPTDKNRELTLSVLVFDVPRTMRTAQGPQS